MLWDWELGWKEPGSSADSSVCGSLLFRRAASIPRSSLSRPKPEQLALELELRYGMSVLQAVPQSAVPQGWHPVTNWWFQASIRGNPLSTHQQPADCCPHPSFPRVNWEPALGEEDVSPSFRCMAKGHDPTLGSHFPFQAEPQVSTRFGQEMERSGQTS